MINPKLPKIWYGGDYNPDQWPREIWQEDMRLFKLAGINIATLPVFSWSMLQLNETTYDFGWLDEILDLLYQNGVHVCLATPTAAVPAWMAHQYPDVLAVNFSGQRRNFGGRKNFCPNSPTYRKYSAAIAEKMAQRYKEHPALVVWHVSNEYGGACYCENCAAAFRVWLQKQYGSLDEVNRRWNTRFWGHTFYHWDEIVPPNLLSEHTNPNDQTRTTFQGISLDYSRFMSDSLLECYKAEYEAIKRYTPNVPVTTNLMGHYKPLDYHDWAPYLDVVSWDSYPSSKATPAEIALSHALMRGLKDGQPFMLMEQTPSQQNWKPYNELKRPGVMRLWSYQAVAHGADTVMFFQLRRSQGACEKYHGAVIEHCGHENTRVFRECAELGKELSALGDTLLGTEINAQVAVLFDWDNWWALEYSAGPSVDLKYLPQVRKYYQALWDLGVATDVIGPKADISKYKVLIAPVAYLLQPGFAQKVEAFVDNGGVFVTTFFSGIVDENDRVVLGGYPGELRKVTGVWAEEIDALFPEQSNAIVMTKPYGKLQDTYKCGLLCDLIHVETAEVIATYGKDFYAGRPVVTRNRYGKGSAWYIASDPEPAFVQGLLEQICSEAGVSPVLCKPAGVEATCREKDGRSYLFVLNHNENAASVNLGEYTGKDLLSGKQVAGAGELPGRGVWIIELDK